MGQRTSERVNIHNIYRGNIEQGCMKNIIFAMVKIFIDL